jgi:hypothetical protein
MKPVVIIVFDNCYIRTVGTTFEEDSSTADRASIYIHWLQVVHFE